MEHLFWLLKIWWRVNLSYAQWSRLYRISWPKIQWSTWTSVWFQCFMVTKKKCCLVATSSKLFLGLWKVTWIGFVIFVEMDKFYSPLVGLFLNWKLMERWYQFRRCWLVQKKAIFTLRWAENYFFMHHKNQCYICEGDNLLPIPFSTAT